MAEPKAPVQKTAKGHEVPVPERQEFYRDLDKVVNAPARPKKKVGDHRSSSE
jgi:hypothetical protein